MGRPHKGRNVPKSPKFLNMTEHCLGKAWVRGGRGSHGTFPGQWDHQLGRKVPENQDLPLLQPASHGGGAQKHVPKPALPS